jgi:hypothetical protein
MDTKQCPMSVVVQVAFCESMTEAMCIRNRTKQIVPLHPVWLLQGVKNNHLSPFFNASGEVECLIN